MSKKKNKLNNAITDSINEFNSKDKTDDFFSPPENIPGNEITKPDIISKEGSLIQKGNSGVDITTKVNLKDQIEKTIITNSGKFKKAIEIIMNKRTKKPKENPHFELPELNNDADGGKILLTVLVMFAIIFAGFMVYYFYPAAPLKRLFISSSLDSFEEHSGKLSINSYVFFKYDNIAGIDDEYLQIHFYKRLDNGEFEYYDSQNQKVINHKKNRFIFFYDAGAFIPWKSGTFKVEIKDSDDDILISKIFDLE